MLRKPHKKKEMVCPICGETFLGGNNSKTCGALKCGDAFRKRKGYVTSYQRRMSAKTFTLRNGLEVLNNAFGKEIANVNS